MEHRIIINKSARYFSCGNPLSNTLCIALHGYGQLASFFIKKFEPLSKLGIYTVAPEGLHRFYVEGFSGRVGASWMTKEDRLSDIADYIAYLNQLYAGIRQHHNYNRLIIIGFSQGVATAFRWIEKADFSPTDIILASGMIPPDVTLPQLGDKCRLGKWTYITGDNDPFRNEKEVLQLKESFKNAQIPLREMVFSGGHSLNIELIEKAIIGQ